MIVQKWHVKLYPILGKNILAKKRYYMYNNLYVVTKYQKLLKFDRPLQMRKTRLKFPVLTGGWSRIIAL